MPTLHLVIAEAAVEAVPEALWSHPSVSRHAKTRGKRPGQLLLDDTFHHSAMRKLHSARRFDEPERRGRPDILHTTLLMALESRLNKEGGLRVWVHTRNDECVTVIPDLRLQRAQHRFYGLLEQLLEHGAVPPDGRADVLMALEPGVDLAGVIARTGANRVVVMDEEGTPDSENPLEEVLAGDDDVCVVVGGFPAGRLTSDLGAAAVQRVALGREMLTAWAVAADVVSRYRLIRR